MNYLNYSPNITYMQQADRENLIKLGKRVKYLREQTKESLNSFVLNRGGLTTATWSRIENGKFDIKFSTLIKVAALLNITVNELLKDIPINYYVNDD